MISSDPPKSNPMEGVTLWRNAKNRFTIFQAHYLADARKREPSYIDPIRASMPIAQFRQEFELVWESFIGMTVYPDWNKAIHSSKVKQTPEMGLPLLLGIDQGLCYSDDTEILTDSGWKLFRDLVGTEKVLCLDKDTKKPFWEVPLKHIAYQYDGEMLCWASSNVNMQVTPDHFIPNISANGVFHRDQAKDLVGKSKRVLLKNEPFDEGILSSPISFMTPLTYSKFMGAYLSEGSVDKNTNRISITQIKDKEWLRDILGQTGLDWHEEENGLRASNRELADHVKKFGYQHERYVPDDIKKAPAWLIQEFIHSYTLGDGHYRHVPGKLTEHCIYTNSTRMKDDFQELAVLCGWNSSVYFDGPRDSHFKDNPRIVRGNGCWQIRFKKVKQNIVLFSAKFEKRAYSGMVYCVTVSSGIIMVRRNGKPHWNGNCPAAVVCQFQDPKLIVFKEYTEHNMGAERFASLVREKLSVDFPSWYRLDEDYILGMDPTGFNRRDVDERTYASVWKKEGFLPRPGENSWEKRRQAVERWLVKFRKGEPCLQVNAAECPILVEGFDGGYRYPESAATIEPTKIKPIKDKYSQPHDALQYILTLLEGKRGRKVNSVPSLVYNWGNVDGGRNGK